MTADALKRVWATWGVIMLALLATAPALAAAEAGGAGTGWLSWARFLWEIAITAAALIGAVLGWVNRRIAGAAKRITALEKDIEKRLREGDVTFERYLERMKATDRRLAQTEAQLQQLSTHLDHIAALAHRMEGTMQATTALTERLNEYLLHEAKR